MINFDDADTAFASLSGPTSYVSSWASRRTSTRRQGFPRGWRLTSTRPGWSTTATTRLRWWMTSAPT